MFEARALRLGLPLAIEPLGRLADAPAHRPGHLALLPVPLAAPVTPGTLDPANAPGVVRMLELAAQACLAGQAAAMVTAPVQKSTINEAGIPFSGHTEFLAALTGTAQVVMLLASEKLRVALATTHLPLAAVPAAITREGLTVTLRIVNADLQSRFGVARPRITVLGLNPHAGEAGVLGSEEDETIRPVVAALRREGLDLRGPVAADSAFTDQALRDSDVVVAMYHDQGLAPLKARHFGEIVNVTLGLPIIRTSVDHGTALALAGSGQASHASLRAALELALELAAGRTE
jgi:4-hydroxythreonine-4-phosphate dehydrogenase